jgi:exosortase/archaeosortase family protein
LNGLGVETIREGVFLTTPSGAFHFQVADICSGMRSLSAITLFIAAYAFFSCKTTLRIFLLLASSFPLVILANILRILLLCFIALLFGQDATTNFIHEAPGLILFYATIVLLLRLGDKIISKVGKTPSATPLTPPARQLDWTAGICCLVFGFMMTLVIIMLGWTLPIQSWKLGPVDTNFFLCYTLWHDFHTRTI